MKIATREIFVLDGLTGLGTNFWTDNLRGCIGSRHIKDFQFMAKENKSYGTQRELVKKGAFSCGDEPRDFRKS